MLFKRPRPLLHPLNADAAAVQQQRAAGSRAQQASAAPRSISQHKCCLGCTPLAGERQQEGGAGRCCGGPSNRQLQAAGGRQEGVKRS